jgi:hypothetical protein
MNQEHLGRLSSSLGKVETSFKKIRVENDTITGLSGMLMQELDTSSRKALQRKVSDFNRNAKKNVETQEKAQTIQSNLRFLLN